MRRVYKPCLACPDAAFRMAADDDDADVMDAHVDAAVLCGSSAEERLDLALVSDVGNNRGRLVPGCPQLGSRRMPVLVPVGEDDGCPLGGEPGGNTRADAVAAPVTTTTLPVYRPVAITILSSSEEVTDLFSLSWPDPGRK